MKWVRRAMAGLWAFFTVGSCIFLWSIWFVETPPWGTHSFLPAAKETYCKSVLPYRQDDDYLWSALYDKVALFLEDKGRVQSLEAAPGVEYVSLDDPQIDLFNTVQPVDFIVVDGTMVHRNDWDDPVKGPILARVLQDAAQIEWRLLWERALGGTAAWSAALAAMIGLTWLLRRMDAHSKKETGQG